MAKDYVFYTSEGYTIAPSGCELDSLQILGFEHGDCYDDALSQLIDNNPWISECGFDLKKISHRVILTDDIMRAIKVVADYTWEEEGEHYEAMGCHSTDFTDAEEEDIRANEIFLCEKALHEFSRE